MCPCHVSLPHATSGTTIAARPGILGTLNKTKSCSLKNIYKILGESKTNLQHEFDSCREIVLDKGNLLLTAYDFSEYEQSNVIFNKNISIMAQNNCLIFHNYMFIIIVFQLRGKVFKMSHQCLIELK